MDREPDAEQNQGEQQDRDDEQHGKLLSLARFSCPSCGKQTLSGRGDAGRSRGAQVKERAVVRMLTSHG
jgi:hypothetical protein